MKVKLLAAAALLVCACSTVPNDLEKYGLNCKASEISVKSDTLEFSYDVFFNPAGQVELMKRYNFDGSFRYREEYSYDSRGHLSEVRGINAEDETEVRYEYDWKGRFISECRIYGMNNEELHRWVHTNDGKHIVRTEYYSEGEYMYTTTKDYSGNGYDEESISAEGNLMGRAHVDFLTEEKPTRIISDAMNVEIDYNDRRLPVRSKETVLNSLCEMQWETGLDDYPERFYTYEYDERGNWISRAERVHPDSAAVVVLRRTIKYQK